MQYPASNPVPVILLLCSTMAPAQQLTVQSPTELTVQLAESCQLSGAAAGGNFGTLNFGSFSQLPQPVQVSSQVSAGSILLRCNLGVNFRILINKGLHGSSVATRQLKEPMQGATLSYQLYQDPQRLQIWDDSSGHGAVATGEAQQFDLHAMLPAQTVAAAGQYSDTLTVTISW
ncbi:spore coat U domain-containing protein [Rheinheimera texasensis]|uniref:Csu type fimbrial protein n=1 Tax=Rheinheimera texasensis TaxID=306205 RepID=UPI0032B1AC2E